MAGTRLKLDFEKPASADRVLRLAKRIKTMIEAAGISSDSDDVTVSIMNLRLNSVITGRTERGVDAVQRTSALLDAAASTKGTIIAPGGAALAAACAELADEFIDDSLSIVLPGRRKPIELAREDVVRLRQVQAAQPPALIRYTSTTVISPVLRCGVAEEGGRIAARIVLSGRNVDLPVAEASVDSFVDALKKRQGQYRIAVSLAFRQDAEGPQLVPSESRALRIVNELALATGVQFLAHAKHVVRLDEEGEWP
jgi:hypothetical protein